MNFYARTAGNCAVLEPKGDLSRDSIETLDQTVSACVAAGSVYVIISFQFVKVVASSAVKELVNLGDLCKQSKGRLIFADVSKPLASIFRVTGLDKAFGPFVTMADAIEVLKLTPDRLRPFMAKKLPGNEPAK